ncbi:hypothetical protein XM25_12295 [Devosia sp. H5989]|nr:hypothetical protein XM25_12295 [Devosia sp. H5989]
MKYLLMLYADEVAGSRISPEDMRGFMQTMYAYQDALTKAGAFVETAPLTPTTQAKTLHLDNGELQVHDGPYAETREQFGGYYIIEASDMDEALQWAAECPAATWGKIEVRQFASFS